MLTSYANCLGVRHSSDHPERNGGLYFPITSMGTVMVFGGMQAFLSQA